MDERVDKVSDIIHVIDTIEAQDNAEATFNIFREFTRRLGGTSLLIGKIVNPIIEGQSITSFGFADWPEEWQKKWVEENYILHDPICKYALTTHQTFEWKTAYELASDFGKRILEEGLKFSSPLGIAIPIRAGELPQGIISIGFDKIIPAREVISLIEMVSIHCYTHILRLLDIMEHPVSDKLTKRETEILNFVAAGKTNWEVSKILKISEHSVAQHMKNIARKMNAANRAHAVTLAIKSGQIIT
jgi:LuxR family quorum sensing-dependent transcriptional regulator